MTIKTLPKRRKKKKLGRPPLHGRPIFVRVHGDVLAKVERAAVAQDCGEPEVFRRLAKDHLP